MKAISAVLLVLLFTTAILNADESDPLGDGDLPPQAVLFGLGAKERARQVERDIRTGRLAEITDMAIQEIIRVSTIRLRTRGYKKEADLIQSEYKKKYVGFLTRMVAKRNRNIGDHEPLLNWLADVTKTLYSTIGFATCKMLHITDLDVLNYAIPVAFNMCTFPMPGTSVPRIEEVRRHLSVDPKYGGGLFPVLVYWTVDIACSAVTFGMGWFFICGPISSAAEWIMEDTISDGLSNWIYKGACGG